MELFSIIKSSVEIIYSKYDFILVGSRPLINVVKNRFNGRIIYFPNWADKIIEDNKIDDEDIFSMNTEKFNIVYTGNIGKAQDFESLIKTIGNVQENIHWTFVGDGRFKSQFKRLIEYNNLTTKVTFIDQVNINLIPSIANKADALFLSLKSDEIFSKTVPAKLQVYMALGKPIIGMLNGEGARLINEADCGTVEENYNYEELAKKIIYPFIGNFMNENDLSKIIDKSYSVFRKKNVVDLVKVGDRSVLELFHGPTLAFKDVAMQLLGNFYEYYLNNENEKLNIVVATSGDTGAAAIDAIKGKKNINIFVLHPHNRVSPVQRKLMTTGKEQNVFNIAINGSFDDCQNLVKLMFADKNFSQDIKMSGVNSINWARIIAQSVYYFYSYFLVEDNKQPINFSVPTGNFGDVYAGYLAKKMGLPINKLIVATNQNDILHRAISKGSYEVEKVHETISPSMDIQIASNFERLLYDLNDGDDIQTAEVMKNIKENGKYIIDQKKSNIINNNFLSSRMSEEEVLKTINTVYEKYSIVLDPHSAIGYGAFDKINLNGNNIVLATAHPCKFPDAIKKAINLKADLPEELMFVLNEEEKFDIIDNDVDKVKKHIKERIQ